MPLKHLHNVYHIKIGLDGRVNRHLAGRFLTAGGHVHILEDYHNLLGGHLTEGPITYENLDQIHRLYQSQYLDVSTQADTESGKKSEFLPEPDLKQEAGRRPSVFEYLHHGNPTSDVVEVRDGIPHFNGVPTSHTHVHALMANVKKGLAVIRYRKDKGESIRKMESAFESILAKSNADEGAVSDAFSRLRELVQAGHLDPEHERTLADLVYKDSMIPELGNKFAFNDFSRRPREGGVHIVMDGNDFKSVNDMYGHRIGDEAIKAMGRATREAIDEAVGAEKAKLFRIGGDEFAAHVPDHESAARFARALRTKLDKLEPIAGVHKLSMSFGFGTNHEDADRALYEAKKQKYSPETREIPDSEREKRVRLFKRGQTPHFAHSLVPGMEGPVPLDSSQLNVTPPPAPAIKEPKLATPSAGARPLAPGLAPQPA